MNSNEQRQNPQASLPRLSLGSLLARVAVIGAILGMISILFAYQGGWLTPRALTPARFADTFERVNGPHPGFRRNHAKGVCASGYFESNGQGAVLSKAAVFQSGRVPVIGRFSLGGGNPNHADAPSSVRGLGLRFNLPNGEKWHTAMINFPVFPFRTPEAFHDQMIASAPDPATGKPDPAKMQAFLAKYPETAKALQRIGAAPKTSEFEESTFNSLNAFRFINSAGAVAWVRWSLAPVHPSDSSKSTAAPNTNQNYLFDSLISAIHRHPLSWHLIITIARPGDSTDDATIPWPPDRQQVDVGTLTLDQIASDDVSLARDINFDPLVLPNGIEPSNDPLLSARSAVYSQSFTRREGEPEPHSPISPAETAK